jgi:ADP-ribosylglycohydrolase
MITLRERYRGALLGLAAGDAVGTTVEFSPPGTFTPVTDMVGGGPFRLRPGEWTDDTSMALCLAESLLERRGFDAADQMARYLRWRNDGHLSANGRCFDIGNTVADALHRFEATGHPWAGSTDPHSAGNGSIMRLAPVPLFYAADAAQAIALSGDSSRTTHGAAACVDAGRYLGGLLVGALRGETKAALLAPFYHPVPGATWQLDPAIAAIAAGSFAHKSPPAIRGSGYVVESLEAALWAFHRSETFAAGCLLAVNLGHDADTTAAVYGQLAGAYYGAAGIPAAWRDRLAHRDLIVDFADRLHDLAQ